MLYALLYVFQERIEQLSSDGDSQKVLGLTAVWLAICRIGSEIRKKFGATVGLMNSEIARRQEFTILNVSDKYMDNLLGVLQQTVCKCIADNQCNACEQF